MNGKSWGLPRLIGGVRCQLAFKSLGQADAAVAGQAVGQLVGDHVLVNARGVGIIGELRGDDGLLGFGQELTQQDGLKLPAGLGDFLVAASVPDCPPAIPRHVAGVNFGLEAESCIQRVISSACNAPACFMA